MILKAVTLLALQLAPPMASPARHDVGAASQKAEVARDSTPPRMRHSAFLELLGNGVLYSLNSEVRFRGDVSLRAGGSHLGAGAASGLSRGRFSLTTVPLLAGVAFGRGEHKLEIAAGATFVWYTGEVRVFVAKVAESGFFPAATAFVGYRFVPEKASVLVRVGVTPLATFTDSVRVLPWGGMAVGGTM